MSGADLPAEVAQLLSQDGHHRQWFSSFFAALGSALTGNRASFEYLRDSILGFPRQVTLAAELHHAGFPAVAWHNLTFGIVAVHVATK